VASDADALGERNCCGRAVLFKLGLEVVDRWALALVSEGGGGGSYLKLEEGLQKGPRVEFQEAIAWVLEETSNGLAAHCICQALC
jgi:hypothetical protein